MDGENVEMENDGGEPYDSASGADDNIDMEETQEPFDDAAFDIGDYGV